MMGPYVTDGMNLVEDKRAARERQAERQRGGGGKVDGRQMQGLLQSDLPQ